MSIAIDAMRTVGVSCWRPRADQKLSEWCEQSIRLSRDTEATPGRYDLSENPFWREIIDAFKDPEVRQISVKKSTQVGGTLLLIAVAWAISEFDPAPAMVVGPDELYCNELKDRIYSNGEHSPAVRDRVPPERLRNNRHVDLGTYRAYLAWAGSAQRLRGRPCKRVFRSEIDVYPKQTPKGGDPLKATRERVKRFFDHTIYDESSPDGDNSAIDQLYEAGHRAKWLCKCPHCGKRQEVRFFVFKDGPRAGNGGIAGFKDENGNFLAPDQVRDAHYRCKEGCRIDQDEKRGFILSGLWVAEGQSIDEETNTVIGEPIRGRRHLSYHVWSAHSPTITFTDIAVAYLEHRRDSKLRDFWQNWLGLKYESRRRLPDWHILGERLSSEHHRGTIPPAAWFLTAGVDVQLHGCWYTIRAWGDQATSWLVDWGHLRRYDTDDVDLSQMTTQELNQFFRSDIAQVRDAVLNRYFPIYGGGTNATGRAKLRPRIVLMDSNYRTREVHAFVSCQDERRMRACRGDHRTKPSERFRITEVEKPARDGPSYATPRKVTQVYTVHFKEAIQEKLVLPGEAPGSFNLFAGVVQSSSDYLRQLTNEQPIDVLDKTTGRKKTVWKPRNEQWGNHCGDTEVYGFCGAEIVLHEMGATWDASTWVAKTSEGRTSHRFEMPTVAVRDYQ
jgi:phage terminase large subunit GpA-like protein